MTTRNAVTGRSVSMQMGISEIWKDNKRITMITAGRKADAAEEILIPDERKRP